MRNLHQIINKVTYRKYKQINKITFKEELQRTLEVQHTTHDLRSLVNRYNSDLRKILDKHAPEKKRLVKITHKQPWFTKIQREIILRRVKEWKWLQDQSYYSFMAFYHQRRYVANTIQQAKREYYSTMLEENRNNVKAVFTIANNLLFRNEPLPLPPTNDKQKLANEFNEFFRTKIQKLWITYNQPKNIILNLTIMKQITLLTIDLMNSKQEMRILYLNSLKNQKQNLANWTQHQQPC